ncbi:hypothetical protein [Funiculus sociatus]
MLKSNPSRPTKPTSSILPHRWRHQCDRSPGALCAIALDKL